MTNIFNCIKNVTYNKRRKILFIIICIYLNSKVINASV